MGERRGEWGRGEGDGRERVNSHLLVVRGRRVRVVGRVVGVVGGRHGAVAGVLPVGQVAGRRPHDGRAAHPAAAVAHERGAVPAPRHELRTLNTSTHQNTQVTSKVSVAA